MTGISRAPSHLTISVDGAETVSGLLSLPDGATASLALAHGAGAGMCHPFMVAVATGLAERSIATLRYQFPYTERGSRRPDAPRVAHATVRAAVGAVNRHVGGLPLFAGGKSFGGRMTSQAQAASALSDVRGLIFFGFPLHPAGKPSEDRAQHLSDVRIPMLFLQGTRDTLAEPALVENVTKRLGHRATLRMFAEADHSFHMPARSGRTGRQVLTEVLDAVADWIRTIRQADPQDG